MDKINENVGKIGKEVKKGLDESYYRFLTLANLAVNKVARPITDGTFNFIEGSIKVEEEKVSSDTTESLKQSIKNGIIKGHQLFVQPLNFLDEVIKNSETEIAQRLKTDYGIDTNQWVFSRENLEMLEKVNTLVDITFAEVRHINKFTTMRYLSAWTIIQKLDNKIRGRLAEMLEMQAHAETIDALRNIQEELFYYALFAHGTYGDIMNYVYSGKAVSKLFAIVNYTEQFILYTKIQKKDLLYSFWDATPYKPAYCITRHEAKKEIILCMRGSNNWADFATDLDFHYMKINIMKENDSKQMYLKFLFDEHTQLNFKERIGENTKDFNTYTNKVFMNQESVVVKGFAHAGMLVSAIAAYKEITPKLEEILAMPENEGYNLVITGHSLGGGMSTLMALLYLVHPLKSFIGRMRGYSYGGAPVLSIDFDIYLKDIMKSVIFENDVVPRLSYGSLRDTCKIILRFEELELEQPQFLKSILNLDVGKEFANIKDEDIAQVQKELELYHDIKSQLMETKLLPMGRAFYIETIKPNEKETKGNKDFSFQEIKNKEFFGEIIYSRELIKHHFPHVYEEGLISTNVDYRV